MLPLQRRTLSNVARLQYNVSVPYPKLGLAENTGNIELGAAPFVQYYSVFSAWPSLRYGTLIQCTVFSVQCAECQPCLGNFWTEWLSKRKLSAYNLAFAMRQGRRSFRLIFYCMESDNPRGMNGRIQITSFSYDKTQSPAQSL